MTNSRATTAPRNVPSEPLVDTHREIRLALVMYGGVSLAIYMNGVSQELYHLVRATAPRRLDEIGPAAPLFDTKHLSPTERVYRKLGQALESLIDDPEAPITKLAPGDPITTRFVIDILAGTSAGGINAVFLGKALANNQSIEELKKLWMEEADISVLLNDSKSRVEGLTLEQPPESLLNSGRMNQKLLKAFDAVEGSRPNPDGQAKSPYMGELDLWVTSTDLRGVTLPLKLANGVAFERRYRNVFHFVYGTERASGGDRNDFKGKNNPILAFAARCTSAFPFAFKPMLLGDLEETLEITGSYEHIKPDDQTWAGFYSSYLPPGGGDEAPNPALQLPFLIRPFADGGALDNKPFTWATRSILRRRADVPVDRKLIFIEPDPGHPESEVVKQGRPNALENFALQGHSLPRQETIRDDIQALLERNRTITRVDRVLQGLADGFLPEIRPEHAGEGVTPETGDDWASEWFDEATPYGRAEAGYARLKVAAVTDDVASLVASILGFDEDSDELLAIGYIIRAWRDRSYAYKQPKPAGEKKSFRRFLLDFDLQHRLRRLTFLRRRVNALYLLGDFARDQISAIAEIGPDEFRRRFPELKEDIRHELRTVKNRLSGIYVRLRFLGRELRHPKDSPLAAGLAGLGIDQSTLRGLLLPASEKDRVKSAVEIVNGTWGALNTVAHELAISVRDGIEVSSEAAFLEDHYGTVKASKELRMVLDPEAAETGAAWTRELLRRYTHAFDAFDMTAFPMLYGTGADETDVVEVVRISPEDATSIIDERATNFSKRKTTGWKYNHFGAFLHEDWRKNDIMFGRLDAAECLINTLIPDGHPDQKSLLEEAQRAIIIETLSPTEQATIVGPHAPGSLSDEQVVDRFRKNYAVLTEPPLETSLPIVARSLGVTAGILGGISRESGSTRTLTGWIARVGSFISRIAGLAIRVLRTARLWATYGRSSSRSKS